MSDIINSEMYIKSDHVNNNNKFWSIEMYADFSVITKWGRVGDLGDSKNYKFPSESLAQKFWDKKIREKTRDGRNGEIAYKKVDVVGSPGNVNVKSNSDSTLSKIELEKLALTQISSNNQETEDLIKRLAKANIHNILSSTTMHYNVESGLFSTPLGIVSKDTIDNANCLLIKIADGILNNLYDDSNFGRLISDYLMLIPQDIGRKFDIRKIFPDLSSVQHQKSILDSLEASLERVVNSNTAQFKNGIKEDNTFSVKLDLISNCEEIDRINKKFLETLHKNHVCSHLRPKRSWNIEISSMKKDFETYGKSIGNVQEYYHGTKISNLLSIMSKGMVIVPSGSSSVTGRMFGDGLYFSSESSKSLNYSYGYWQGSRDNNCFMLMAQVAMGNYFVPNGPKNFKKTPDGYDSVWAKAKQSGVLNHEMIVYNKHQVNPTHLIEFA
jgi:poly [ADP-ribose] polymerase